MKKTSIYNSEISRGSLMPLESRRVAKFLLTEPKKNEWTHAIEKENILQKDTPETARRQAKLIRKRLLTLDKAGWELISERENEVTNQLLFAAAIKDSKLLGDFMLNLYASRQRRMETSISPSNWEDFLTECAHYDPSVLEWNKYTKSKSFNSIINILVEAKYLDDAKTMKLTPQSLHPHVKRYLLERDENYIVECLERSK